MTGTRENKDYDWAFDLRAFNCDSDDNSDNDCQAPRSNKKQHEVRLEDFDLGSREEAVSYKPNPFSIARINAAYRSARSRGSEAKSSLPQNSPPGKACGLVQTKIDDILKKQKSSSLKKAVATKDSRPGASCAYSETDKLKELKIGPRMDRAFFRPQIVEKFNPNSDDKDSSTMRSGCSPSLKPTALSANAHTLTLSADAPSRLNDEPPCVLPSPSENGYIKPELMSPYRDFSLFSSSMRSKPETKRNFPKHESPPLTLSTSQPIPEPVLSNSGQVDQKCDHRVKQEFRHSSDSEIPPLGRIEDVCLPHASAPYIPSPRNCHGYPKPLAMNTGLFRAPAPLPTVHKPKRQQITAPVVPLKRDVRDVYNFSVEDTDENWCTLPARKKQKSKLFRPIIISLITYGLLRNHLTFGVTKSFRLPGLLPPQKIVETGTDDTSGKRVVTYLPPPLMHHADELIHPAASYPISQVQNEKRSLARPSRLAATSYPSPDHPRISRPFQVYPVSPTTREQTYEVYRPPSPPTSDPPASGYIF